MIDVRHYHVQLPSCGEEVCPFIPVAIHTRLGQPYGLVNRPLPCLPFSGRQIPMKQKNMFSIVFLQCTIMKLSHELFKDICLPVKCKKRKGVYAKYHNPFNPFDLTKLLLNQYQAKNNQAY
jgi:hypothetical protein